MEQLQQNAKCRILLPQTFQASRPFEHNGSCATLEDWFNPARTNDTYIPTGWKGPLASPKPGAGGPGTTTRAVKGHEFGLDLSENERKALIAFLKTL